MSKITPVLETLMNREGREGENFRANDVKGGQVASPLSTAFSEKGVYMQHHSSRSSPFAEQGHEPGTQQHRADHERQLAVVLRAVGVEQEIPF